MKNKTTVSGVSKPAPSKNQGPMTIEMVAKEAGVSPSTVSRILNGTAVVSEAKKKSVEDAVAKLGFVPNPMARGLAGGRTFSVGVITQSMDSPFYGPALRGIEDTLDPAGYSPLFVSGNWQAPAEARCIDILLSRRVDGIIVLTGRLTDAALKACAKKVPVVVTGRNLKAADLFSLNFDNLEGARLATWHLIDQGHTQIAFISGDPQHPDAVQRLAGYKLALEQAGIAFQPSLVVQGEYNEDSGLQAVLRLMATQQRFTAIFAANDQMAVGAAHGLLRQGLRVPEDVSLVGFDDLPNSLYAFPPLTTVHQPAYEMGQLAAEAMLNLLAGIKPQLQVPAPRLIPRESCRRLNR
ncbi:LacI family DNA-binding transcriptional regulator [Hydrogenophaga sp.]|uniref:LacI family DNA-binding transcriptional regulator n=1 Tax=Hydrogenophaga sp. TaxID=1904254 RepID=UPI003F6B9118